MPTPLPLADRRVLVTGASSGIGAGLASAFAEAGARVYAVARSSGPLDQLAAEHQSLAPVSADLTTDAGRRAVATAIEHAGGVLDVAVHAAGALGPPNTPLAEYPEAEWHRVFEINVTAVHLLHQLLVPPLMRSDDPVVIGVSSTVGRSGRGGWGMYSVSKHALEGWLSTLADEFEGRVYSVNPGGTRTPMRARARPDEDPESIPSPADIAPLFLRLARSGGDEPTGTRFDARDWIGTDPWS